MRVMRAARLGMPVIVGGEVHVVRAVAVFRRGLLQMAGRRAAAIGAREFAIHRDGRQRLNRKAQDQQHDNEELAPI